MSYNSKQNDNEKSKDDYVLNGDYHTNKEK